MTIAPIHFPEVAATLAANGYRPVPITPGLKYPNFGEWEKFIYTPGCEKQYPQHGAGVLLGDVVGLDIDVDDPDAAAAIENAAREILGLGDVAEIPRRIGRAPRVLLPLRTSTPFRKITSALFRMRSTGTSDNKVEVLCDGQQFIAFHIHPTTRQAYTWNGAGDLLSVPRAELPEISEAQARRIIGEAEAILAEWGERVTEPDEKKQGATPGQKIVAGERNETLYRFGCKLARERFTVDEIEAALLAMNAARCDPPLTEDEVRGVVHKSVAKHVQPDENSAPMPKIYSVADMQARPDTAREWILDEWLPARSNVVVGGHGGSGKSMLMAMLAVCVDGGVPFYGIAVKRGPVLVYACEDDIDEWKFRLRCAAAYRGVDFDSLSVRVIDALESERDPALFAPPVTDLRADAAVTPIGAWLADQIKATAPVLVILDAATDAFGGDEIRRREVRRYLRAMRRELAGGGACVVHILHIDKSAARGATTTDLYSGSTDWNNGVRARLAFYRPRQPADDSDGGHDDEETPLRLELQKANYAKRGAFIDLRYDETAHVFVQVGGSEPTAADDLVSSIRKRTDEREVLQALATAEDAGDPVFSSENARRNAAARLEAANALPKTFRGRAGKKRLFSLLLRLKVEGALAEDAVWTPSRHRAGVWRVTPKGRAEPYRAV